MGIRQDLLRALRDKRIICDVIGCRNRVVSTERSGLRYCHTHAIGFSKGGVTGRISLTSKDKFFMSLQYAFDFLKTVALDADLSDQEKHALFYKDMMELLTGAGNEKKFIADTPASDSRWRETTDQLLAYEPSKDVEHWREDKKRASVLENLLENLRLQSTLAELKELDGTIYLTLAVDTSTERDGKKGYENPDGLLLDRDDLMTKLRKLYKTGRNIRIILPGKQGHFEFA